MMTIDQIEAAALALPEAEIDELIDRLTIHHGLSPENEQRWMEEVERRVAEYDTGQVGAIPVEETLARLRAMVLQAPEPPFPLDEVAAVALQLPRRYRLMLLYALEDSVCPPVDPADLEEAHRRLDDMKSGRVKAIPAEEVLAELDRIAESG